MALSLADFKKNDKRYPPRVVIYGTHKIGKTTLTIKDTPSPVILQLEDGAGEIPGVTASPQLTTFADFMSSLDLLLNEKHDFKTLSIDSLDWLEPLVWQKVCDLYGAKNIDSVLGGYGKGYKEAVIVWRDVLGKLDRLRKERGMLIFLIAHYKIKAYNDPEHEPYDRYMLKLHDDSAAVIQEWADVIGFANYRAYSSTKKDTFGNVTGRATGAGERVLHLQERPQFVAGSRFALPEEVELNWPALSKAIIEAQKKL